MWKSFENNRPPVDGEILLGWSKEHGHLLFTIGNLIGGDEDFYLEHPLEGCSVHRDYYPTHWRILDTPE